MLVEENDHASYIVNYLLILFPAAKCLFYELICRCFGLVLVVEGPHYTHYFFVGQELPNAVASDHEKLVIPCELHFVQLCFVIRVIAYQAQK